jgi:hypothetical protein
MQSEGACRPATRSNCSGGGGLSYDGRLALCCLLSSDTSTADGSVHVHARLMNRTSKTSGTMSNLIISLLSCTLPITSHSLLSLPSAHKPSPNSTSHLTLLVPIPPPDPFHKDRTKQNNSHSSIQDNVRRHSGQRENTPRFRPQDHPQARPRGRLEVGSEDESV